MTDPTDRPYGGWSSTRYTTKSAAAAVDDLIADLVQKARGAAREGWGSQSLTNRLADALEKEHRDRLLVEAAKDADNRSWEGLRQLAMKRAWPESAGRDVGEVIGELLLRAERETARANRNAEVAAERLRLLRRMVECPGTTGAYYEGRNHARAADAVFAFGDVMEPKG